MLLLYPDHPYALGALYGKEFDQELKRNASSSLPRRGTSRRPAVLEGTETDRGDQEGATALVCASSALGHVYLKAVTVAFTVT
jgi:hypothetical protein